MLPHRHGVDTAVPDKVTLRPIAGLGGAPRLGSRAGRGGEPTSLERAARHGSRARARAPGALSGIATRPGGRAASIGPRRPGRWLAPPGRRVEQLSQELAEVERSLAALLPSTRPICSRSLASDPSAPRSCSSRAATPGGWSVKPPSPRSPAPAPIDASSGQQRRHRLNRSGDRQLNWAPHVIALARIQHHPETTAYYQRLLARGRTAREARRCVKRALARHFYGRLHDKPALALTP
jgi:transposase